MRKLAVAVFAAITILRSSEAIAQDADTTPTTVANLPQPLDGICDDTLSGSELNCGGDYTADIGPVVSTVPEGRGSTFSGVRYVAYEYLDVAGGPNGEACTAVGYTPEEPATGPPNEAERLGTAVIRGVEAAFPDCPVAPTADPVPAAELDPPRAYAVQYWQAIPLPKPEPYIAPGRAITGLDAYLETRGTTTHTYNEADTPFGALTIVATGKYYVDWGDGTTTGPHSREGKPWPDGEIKHQYINIGSYDVVVTERWTATWSFGSASGTLDELRTVGRIEDFPVGQIQAVVYQ